MKCEKRGNAPFLLSSLNIITNNNGWQLQCSSVMVFQDLIGDCNNIRHSWEGRGCPCTKLKFFASFTKVTQCTQTCRQTPCLETWGGTGLCGFLCSYTSDIVLYFWQPCLGSFSFMMCVVYWLASEVSGILS